MKGCGDRERAEAQEDAKQHKRSISFVLHSYASEHQNTLYMCTHCVHTKARNICLRRFSSATEKTYASCCFFLY